VRAADSRAFWTAGTSMAIKMAMTAITTKSSMSVNAGRLTFIDSLNFVWTGGRTVAVFSRAYQEKARDGRDVRRGRKPRNGRPWAWGEKSR
jgi:hypothetical protein